jgi:hypothetical protein
LEISAIREDMTGHGPGQRVKKKSMTQTFPNRSARVRVFPSCVVNWNGGTIPIGGAVSVDFLSEAWKSL